MKDVFRKYVRGLSRGYLIFIAIAALLFLRVVYSGFYTFYPDENIVYTKVLPVTVEPMLSCALLAAFFVMKGYARAVGLGALLLITAAGIVAGGSMMWMHSMTMGGQEAPLTTLCGYQIRQPLALFLVACAFMRGGACALLTSLLAYVRQSRKRGSEGLLFASTAVLALFLAAWGILVRVQMTWSLCAGVSLLYVIAVLPSLAVELLRKTGGVLDTRADWPQPAGGLGLRESVLPVAVLAMCGVCFLSFWKYIPYYWRNNVWTNRAAYFAVLSFSLLTLSAGLLLILRRFSRNGDMGGLPVIGGLLFVLGMPLASILLGEGLLALVPQMLIGLGAAIVIGPTLDALVGVHTRWYPFLWVGVMAGVSGLSGHVAFFFRHLEGVLRSGDVAAYILFPIMGLVVVVMSYCLQKSNR